MVSPPRIGLRRTWCSARLITGGSWVFGLGWCELPECAVWPRVVDMMQVDRQDPA